MKRTWLAPVAAVLLLSTGIRAENAKAYDIRMHRADMPDTTDIPSILRSILKPGMSDEEKAKAIWRFVFKYSHQDAPPQEQIAGCTHDVVKLVNVYGYRMCCCAAGCVEALADAAGFQQSRTHGVTAHNVAEVYYDNAWHMLDSSLITYFKKDDGSIASVEELNKDGAKLLTSARCPFADAKGWFPAMTHNLNNAHHEYSKIHGEAGDGVSNGYSVGHRASLTLREGETMTRNFGVENPQHVNQDLGGPPGSVKLRGGKGEAAYFNKVIPDQKETCYYVHPGYHGGVVGNGTLTYEPELAKGGYARGMEAEENISCKSRDGRLPALHLKKRGPGSVVFRMRSPYVFLDGEITATFKRKADDDVVEVFVSTNNMLDWQRVYTATQKGAFEAKIPLKEFINRRYEYYVKVAFDTKGYPTDVGMEEMRMTGLFQHAERAAPFLVRGDNEILVDAGKPASTVSINPRVTTAEVSPEFKKNETLTTMHAVISGMDVRDGYLWDNWKGGGTVTFPVTVPGNITGVRMGGTFRMRDAADKVKFQVSTAGPDTGFQDIHELAGKFVKKSAYTEYTKIPPGKDRIWVRFATTVRNTCGVMGHLRIDVDYQEAKARQLPFKVRHDWLENGQAKSHTETIKKWPHKYNIKCSGEPEMKSIKVWVEQASK